MDDRKEVPTFIDLICHLPHLGPIQIRNPPLQLLKHDNRQLSCSFGVYPQSFANVRGGIIGRLRCGIVQDMVGDVWEIGSPLLYSIQDLWLWNPALLRKTEFDHKWHVLACARRSEYRCTASDDAIWTMDDTLAHTKSDLHVVIASEGPPRLSLRYNPPIFFGESLPCEQQDEETGEIFKKIETRGLNRALWVVPPVPQNHICDRNLVQAACEDLGTTSLL